MDTTPSPRRTAGDSRLGASTEAANTSPDILGVSPAVGPRQPIVLPEATDPARARLLYPNPVSALRAMRRAGRWVRRHLSCLTRQRRSAATGDAAENETGF